MVNFSLIGFPETGFNWKATSSKNENFIVGKERIMVKKFLMALIVVGLCCATGFAQRNRHGGGGGGGGGGGHHGGGGGGGTGDTTLTTFTTNDFTGSGGL